MFARDTPDPVKTRVVAQCRDADFDRLLRATFGMDAKVELVVANGVFAEAVRKLDTNGATVVIVDIDPASEADFAALNALTQRNAGLPPVIVAIPAFEVTVARQLLQMRVADFVVKPVAPLDLVRACAAPRKAEQRQSEARFSRSCPRPAAYHTTLAIETAMLAQGEGGRADLPGRSRFPARLVLRLSDLGRASISTRSSRA